MYDNTQNINYESSVFDQQSSELQKEAQMLDLINKVQMF